MKRPVLCTQSVKYIHYTYISNAIFLDITNKCQILCLHAVIFLNYASCKQIA